jgi:hypothetical protein
MPNKASSNLISINTCNNCKKHQRKAKRRIEEVSKHKFQLYQILAIKDQNQFNRMFSKQARIIQ